MVQINFAQKKINAKIVYYGPGMSGKTTNLEVIHQRAPEPNRGDLTSISTDGDRTLFFDYMPLDLGTVAGMRTCFQVYTVPGQVYYNSTRKLVLQGVDGVIFVADSQESMREQNLESLRNLEENLQEYGKSLETLPHVLQWNKRDMPNAVSVATLEGELNKFSVPSFEAVANTGQGVFPTLKALAAQVLKNLSHENAGGGAGGQSAGAPQTQGQAAPAGLYQTGFSAPPQPAAAAGTPAQAAPTSIHNVAAQQQAMPQQAGAGPISVPLTDTGMVPRSTVPQAPQQAPQQAPAAAMPAASAAPQQMQPQMQPQMQQPVASQTATARATAPAQAHQGQPQVATQQQGARQIKPQARPGAKQAPRGAQARNVHRRIPASNGEAEASPKGKGGMLYTGAFIVLATAVGAVLARAILSVL